MWFFFCLTVNFYHLMLVINSITPKDHDMTNIYFCMSFLTRLISSARKTFLPTVHKFWDSFDQHSGLSLLVIYNFIEILIKNTINNALHHFTPHRDGQRGVQDKSSADKNPSEQNPQRTKASQLKASFNRMNFFNTNL